MGRVMRRGSPIYVQSGGRVISLVEEVEAREIGFKMVPISVRRLSPSALYVIDEDGVQRLRFDRGVLRFATFAVGLLLGPLLYHLLAKGKAYNGRR